MNPKKIGDLILYLWNRVQRPFFRELAASAKIHPWAKIHGRKQISIGPRTRVYAHSRMIAQEKGTYIDVGSECAILSYAMLMTYGGFIKVGDHCSVNPFCILYGHGGLTIGNGVRIAAGTVIVPANHVFSDVNSPMHKQGTIALGIVIEDDVWIGANATVLDGVRVGKGVVIGAGAVVTHDIEPFHVVGGVPARTLHVRG